MIATIIGLLTIAGLLIGATWKLLNHINNIEKTLQNDFEHRFQRLEEKVEIISVNVYKIMGALDGYKEKT